MITDPEQMRAEAKRRGTTMERVCEHAGVAVTTFGRWLRQENSPRLDTVRSLNDALEEIAPEVEPA